MVRVGPGQAGGESTYDTERYGVTLENARTGTVVSLEPAVSSTETKVTGDMVTFTDQCGHEEADQTGSGNAQHSVEGRFYKEVVQELYDWYKRGDKVDLTLPANLDTVSLFITDVTVNQTQENQVFVDRDGNEDRLIFPTQIQLKASGAIEDGSTPQ